MNIASRIKELTDKMNELSINPISFLKETQIKRSKLNIDSRNINHWNEKDLLLNKATDGKNYVFNLPEAFWIKILMKLRSFNVSLDVIKKIKETLIKNSDIPALNKDIKNDVVSILQTNGYNLEQINSILKDETFIKKIENVTFNKLEESLLFIIVFRQPYCIWINEEGTSILELEAKFNYEIDEKNDSDREFDVKLEEIKSKSHLKISLNEILEEIVDCFGELTCSTQIPILSKSEVEILRLIREENINKIEIKFDENSKPKQIEITKANRIDESASLKQLIIAKSYQELKIITQNGKISYCENKIKYKLDTE